MIGYLIRRIGQAVVVVIGVTIIVFTLAHMLPGNQARTVLGTRATSQLIAQYNHAHGLDRPLPVQYWYWVKNVVVGDPTCNGCHLGFSDKLNQSVDSLLAEDLPKSLILVGLSTVLALVLAIPLGLLQAVRRNKPIDYALTGASFIGYSMPIFWIGLVLVDLVADKANLLPAQAPQGNWSAVLSQFNGIILPVVALAIVTIASFSRYQRSATLDNLAQDYVRTARAKGLSDRRILWGHVLRNTLIPIVTLLGLNLPLLLSGALITEQVFNYPGMGNLFWQATQTQDYNIMLGVTLVVGVATVIGSLLADIGYAVLDPRVRYT